MGGVKGNKMDAGKKSQSFFDKSKVVEKAKAVMIGRGRQATRSDGVPPQRGRKRMASTYGYAENIQAQEEQFVEQSKDGSMAQGSGSRDAQPPLIKSFKATSEGHNPFLANLRSQKSSGLGPTPGRGRGGIAERGRGGFSGRGSEWGVSGRGSEWGVSGRGSEWGVSGRGRGGIAGRGRGGIAGRGRGGIAGRGRGGIAGRGRGGFAERGRGGIAGRGGGVSGSEEGLASSLHVKGIPDELNVEAVLQKHFTQFGKVTNLLCVPQKKFAQVTFASNSEAMNAKRYGTNIENVQVKIFWNNQQHSWEGRSGPVEQATGPPYSRGGVATGRIFKAAIPPTGRVNPGSHVTGSDQRGNPFTPPTSGPPARGAVVYDEGLVFDEDNIATEDYSYHGNRGHERREVGEYVPGSDDEQQENEDNREDASLAAQVVREPVQPTDYSQSMDTIQRRHLSHQYNLRSLHRGGQGDSARSMTLQSTQILSSLTLPLPTHPGGLAAKNFYEALNERDKRIRDRYISSEGKVVGTCPDMCPEKERYLREYQRRLSQFEIVRGTEKGPQVDHKLAVKEYCKSAADQDTPLPHELRPIPVLQMTMDYLIVNIVSMYDRVSKELWYDFLWDRMRSVRKDIRLQNLCSVETVDIIEKCARFHILCGYLYCEEEEMHIYDPSINQEHLMKCVQSLIEGYRDLRIQGVHCTNEAEFAGYDILLHLTADDMMTRVTKYSHNTIGTGPVQFALQVSKALQSGNFVRFFKLTRNTTFLNSCILHKYFSKVRSSALKVIVQSHSTPGKRQLMPLEELQGLLALSTDKVEELCQLHGLDTDGTQVYFQKGSCMTPDLKEMFDRDLVDAKCNTSYSIVVYGGPLPSLRDHAPQLSFSQHGTPVDVQKPTQLPNEIVESGFEVVLSEVLSEELVGLVIDVVEEKNVEETVVQEACTQLLVGVVDEETNLSVQQTLAILKEEELERKVANETVAMETFHEMLDDTVKLDCVSAVQEAYDCVVSEVAFESVTFSESVAYLSEVVQYLLKGVAQQVLEEERQARRRRLEKLAKQMQKHILKRFFKQWHCMYLRCMYVHKQERGFPVSGPNLPLSQQVATLCSDSSTIQPAPDMTEREDLFEELQQSIDQSQNLLTAYRKPLEMCSLVGEPLLAKMVGKQSDWTLSVMDTQINSKDGKLEWEWLISKLSSPDVVSNVQNISNSGRDQVLLLEEIVNDKGNLRLCVKVVSNTFSSDGPSEAMKGVSAILLHHVVTMETSHTLSAFLTKMDRALWSSPPVPVIILVLGNEVDLVHRIASSVKLGNVSQIVVRPFHHGVSWEAIEEVQSAVKWLAENSTTTPVVPIELSQVLQKGLFDILIAKLHQDALRRSTCNALPQGAKTVVELYNSVVDHVIEVVTGEYLREMSYPDAHIAEHFEGGPSFHWNTREQLDSLKRQLLLLKLPSPPVVHSSAEVPSSIRTYFNHWLVTLGDKNRFLFLSEIDVILAASGVRTVGDSYRAHPPWPQLVVAVAIYICQLTDYSTIVWLPWKQWENDLMKFVAPLSWQLAVQSTDECEALWVVQMKDKKMTFKEEMGRVQMKNKKIGAHPSQVPPTLKLTEDDRQSLNHLTLSLRQERTLTSRFSADLSNVLEGDGTPAAAEDSLSPPKLLEGGVSPKKGGVSLEEQLEQLIKEMEHSKRHLKQFGRKLEQESLLGLSNAN